MLFSFKLNYGIFFNWLYFYFHLSILITSLWERAILSKFWIDLSLIDMSTCLLIFSCAFSRICFKICYLALCSSTSKSSCLFGLRKVKEFGVYSLWPLIKGRETLRKWPFWWFWRETGRSERSYFYYVSFCKFWYGFLMCS